MKRLIVLLAMLFAAPAWAQPGATEPGTGPGLGTPDPADNPMPGRTDPNLSDEERGVLRDVEAEWQRYVDAADKHQARIRELLLGELQRRVAQIERDYAEKISKAAADKAKWRADTKALLLKFIEEHPDHEQFTPDARFRLADILLDEADDFVDQSDASLGLIADYHPSMEQWELILKDFPDYRQLPSVLYLLAHYGKVDDERRSLQLFLSLTCANKYKWTDPPPPLPTREEAIARIQVKTYVDPYPDCEPIPGAEPELLHHAWVRGIADYEFSIPGELDNAISGYLRVADKAKDSPLYAEALYKLAWSYYKHDLPVDSIKRFDDSVKLYDATVAAGQTPSLELRDESLQYIAVAFTDPWPAMKPGDVNETDPDPVKAMDRAREFYKGREGEPHVRDVWVALGRAFLELQAYEQAIESFRIAIGPPWELDPDNPVVHQEIVDAYELMGDKLSADAAAAELATRYAPGTPWYTANEKDREAMDNQRRIAERALYASALNTHAAATEKRTAYEDGGKTDEGLHQEYLGLYESAVKLYQTFIQQYPESDYVYLFTFMRGEALFYSGRYLESVVDYKWVRDHKDLSTELFLDAAKSVLAAYEAEVQRQIADGKLNALVVPNKDDLKALTDLSPQPIPQLYQDLQAEWDSYQEKVPDPKSAPQQGINAALVSLAYLHLDDALKRFDKVLTSFCDLKPREIAATVKKVERNGGAAKLYLDVDEDVKKDWDGYLVGADGKPIAGGKITLWGMENGQAVAGVNLSKDKVAKVKKAMIFEPTAATRAKDAMVVIYDVTGKLDELEAINQRFLKAKCGSENERLIAETQNRSIDFRRAFQQLENKEYIPAGESFYTYYKTAPAGDPDLPTALYNAAVSYKLGDRPKTAVSLFKEFTQSKEQAFVESPYYLEAMRLTAISYQSAYDYKNAIASYLSLYELAKNAKAKGIKPPDPIGDEPPQTLEKISLDALFNAAVLYELDRDFPNAIAYYKKYIKEENDRRGKDRAWFSIARIYSQSGDVDKLIATYKTWRGEYGTDDGNADDYVYSYYDIAKLYQRKGKTKDSNEWGQKAIKAWKDTGSPTNTRGAKLAGEYALLFAERHYLDVFVPLSITKKPKTAKESQKHFDTLLAATKKAQGFYTDLVQFGVLELSYASRVRFGECASGFVEKVRAIPYSTELENLNNKNPDMNLLAMVDEELTKTLEPYKTLAKEKWVEVVESAKKNQISNQWSQLALEDLNIEYPDEYPVLHQELFEGTDKP